MAGRRATTTGKGDKRIGKQAVKHAVKQLTWKAARNAEKGWNRSATRADTRAFLLNCWPIMRTTLSTWHTRVLVALAAAMVSAHPAACQRTPDSIGVRAGLVTDIRRAAPDSSKVTLRCATLVDVRPRVRSTATAPAQGEYLLRDVAFDWEGVASATAVPLRCGIVDSSGSEKDHLLVTVRAAAAQDMSLAFEARVAINEAFTPLVRVTLGNIPVANAPVEVDLHGGNNFTAPVASSVAGIATFPDDTLSSASASGTRRIRVRIGGVTRSIDIPVGAGILTTITSSQASTQKIGEPFAILATLRDANAHGVCQASQLVVRASASAGIVKQDKNVVPSFVTKCDSPETAIIQGLVYEGRPGDVTFTFEAGGITGSTRATMVSGPAARMRVLQAPPTHIAPDDTKPLTPAPQLRLEDRFGNPVADEEILAHLECVNRKPCDAQLGGTVRLTTNAAGIVSYDKMTFTGREEKYRFCFEDVSNGQGSLCANPTSEMAQRSEATYDVDREFNKGFVIVSAIHSLAGTNQPDNEFFDIRFRFRLPGGFSAQVASDLSVQRASTSDSTTVKSNQRYVTDAAALLNWSGIGNIGKRVLRVTDPRNDALDRLLALGAQARIFAGVPYYGVHASDVEMRNSMFFGSSLTVGYIRPLSYLPIKVPGNTVVSPTQNNIVTEAFLRSDSMPFLQHMNVRATFLLPFDIARRVQSRIAIAVPIGGITEF